MIDRAQLVTSESFIRASFYIPMEYMPSAPQHGSYSQAVANKYVHPILASIFLRVPISQQNIQLLAELTYVFVLVLCHRKSTPDISPR